MYRHRRILRRHLLSLAMAVLLAAGCAPRHPPPVQTSPPPPPAETEPGPGAPDRAPVPPPADPPPATGEQDPGPAEPTTPPAPRLESLQLDLAETAEGSGWLLGSLTVAGTGPVVVGTDQFTLHARIRPAPPARWFYEQVQVSGATPLPLREELFADGLLELSFPRGEAGDEITVKLNGVQAPWDDRTGQGLTLSLLRAAEPRARLEVRTTVGWHEVGPWDIFPPTPLTLRLLFTNPMDKPLVEAAVSAVADQPGAWLEWQDDQTLVWHLPDPPTLMELDLTGARDQNGLWLVGALPVVRTGAVPYLESVSLETDERHQLFSLPPEIFAAQPSPTGDQLLIQAYRRQTGLHGPTTFSWLVNLADGTRISAPVSGTPLWLPSGWLLDLAWDQLESEMIGPDGAGYPGPPIPPLQAPAISPDGRWVAGLQVPADASDEPAGFFFPHQLVLVEVKGARRAELSPFIRIYLPPRDWYTRLNLTWSPDSTRVAALADTPDGAELIIANREVAQARARVIPLRELAHGSIFGTYWSPDGRQILAGPLILDTLTGTLVDRLPAANGGQALRHVQWSPDGEWVVYTDQWDEWGPVFGYHLPTRQLRRLGHGLPAGWTADGRSLIIRWDGAPAG